MSTAQTQSSDRKCSTCPQGQWQPEKNQCGCLAHGTCKQGQYAHANGTSTKDIRCASCGLTTYQDSANHRLPVCKDQPTCSVGMKITAYTATAAQRCVFCETNTFQDKAGRRDTVCTAHKFCEPGFALVGASISSGGICQACPGATFLNSTSQHRITGCTPQEFCGPGNSYKGNRVQARQCIACADGTYITDKLHRLGDCFKQPSCTTGQ